MSDSSVEPEIVVEHREQLIYLLTEAAEIEHGLMCCYLYAAYSLKRGDQGLRDEERDAVERWRSAILEVAKDEMVHLALVSNLLASIGSAPHFARPNFPVAPGYHPAGVVVSLAPFDRATLDHFIYLERPEGVELPDGQGFTPRTYERGSKRGRLVPTAQDYRTVGHLYRGLRSAFTALSASLGEAALFVGDPRQQIGPDVMPLHGMSEVRSLRDAHVAIDTIVAQGEGAASHDGERSHYAKFLGIRQEYEALLRERSAFEPATNAARNPVMRRPPEPDGKVWVSAEPAATLLDLANASYALMLRALGALFSPVASEPDARGALTDLAVVAMRVMSPLSERIATLPASDADPSVKAGVTFTMSRSIHAPLDARALRGVAELAGSVARRINEQAELATDPGVLKSAAALEALGNAIASLSTRQAQDATPPKPPIRVGADAPPPADSKSLGAPVPSTGVEIARGRALTVLFEGKRCIHSRHCVLDAPGVFLANTPGEWIFPDATTAETLVGVAHACPSGAIRYERHDGGEDEAAPPVNVARIRENGPLAIHAAIDIQGHGSMFRATLCRCGASNNKPFCDGSHVAAGFTASGEPASGKTDPLEVRSGALMVTPKKDGPLAVRGNLELCAGTGRVIARVTQAAFCRCGGSKNKPFCDGSHASNGFRADGS